VGFEILSGLRLRRKNVEIVACPSCGRDEVDGGVETLAREVQLKPHRNQIQVISKNSGKRIAPDHIM
jgi:4-hydroxy-3-methylbut-2-en-1-yl diphosphate synthase IspG/GcpE